MGSQKGIPSKNIPTLPRYPCDLNVSEVESSIFQAGNESFCLFSKEKLSCATSQGVESEARGLSIVGG